MFSVIKEYLVFTIIFSSICFAVQICSSYLLAIKAFKRKGGILDNSLSHISLIIYSIPAFVIAIILIYIFSVNLNLLPSSGIKSINFHEFTFPEKLFDYFTHLILPVVTLSLGGMVIFYKYLRENFDAISKKSYILFLRTIGLNENEILKKHIIPNAAGPFVSVAGVELGILLSGALITEVIYGLPGMGRLTVNAILLRDYPLVVGCTFISGVLIVFTNFLADLIKVKIDKRLVKEILN